MISIFVACPALAICTYNAYVKELEHKAHGTSDFVSYAHLRIRNKVGDQTEVSELKNMTAGHVVTFLCNQEYLSPARGLQSCLKAVKLMF